MEEKEEEELQTCDMDKSCDDSSTELTSDMTEQRLASTSNNDILNTAGGVKEGGAEEAQDVSTPTPSQFSNNNNITAFGSS